MKAISTPIRSGAVMARRQMGAIAEEGAPLNWRPSAHAVAGNGAPLNTRCAPPSAVADAGKARHPEGSRISREVRL
jgi:hypothetical protein